MNRYLAIVFLLCATTPALAQEVRPSATLSAAERARVVFKLGRKGHVEALRKSVAASGPAVTDATEAAIVQKAEAADAPRRVENVDEPQRSSGAELASLAIKTDVADVSAGITFAPLALFGLTGESARATTITIANLDEGDATGLTRLGVGWGRQLDSGPTTLTDLRLGACPLDEGAVNAALDEIEPQFAYLCAVMAALGRNGMTAEGPDGDGAWSTVVNACELPGAPAGAEIPLMSRAGSLVIWSDLVLANPSEEAAAAVPAITDAKNALAAWQGIQPSRTSCNTDDEIKTAIVAYRWLHPQHSINVTGQIDWFGRVYGFNPADNPGTTDDDDETRLSRGEVQSVGAQLVYGFRLGRTTFSANGGWETQRTTPSGDRANAVTVGAGIEITAARLGEGHLLDEDGHPNLINGKLPPHVVLGASVKASIVKGDHEGLDDLTFDQVPSFDATVFADFKVSEDLAFRIGVPVHAEIVTREANPEAMPAITERRGRQWSVPVFVTTVLAID